jgi:hypothetical protein
MLRSPARIGPLDLAFHLVSLASRFEVFGSLGSDAIRGAKGPRSPHFVI